MRSRIGRLSVSTALSLLAGCTVGPNFEAAKPWFSPSSWFADRTPAPVPSEPVAAPIDPNWWGEFKDPELTALESRVAAANLNIRLAGIRLGESRAQLGIARADEMPTLDANGSYTRERLSQKGVIALLGGSGGGSSGGSFASQGSSASGINGTSGAIPSTVTGGTVVPPFNVFQYGFDASWEIDFWGRARREVEAARASAVADEESRRNALLSVLAEVARDYIQLRGVQASIAITNENLGTANESLHLTEERAAGGLTTDLDVANARAQVATTAAQLPNLQQQESQFINALSLLLAEPPNALRTELAQAKPIPPVPPTVPIGLPSELARRRPDIRQAEAQLHAATADIGVAVADFYPRVTLSGSIGLQALMAKDLGNWASRQYGLGPTVTLPLFEGGRLKATLELRKQQQQEAAINYQQTVLQALHDVDNSLIAYDAEQRRNAQIAAAVAANRQALSLARQRYDQGIATFLDVLDAQRSLLATQTQLVNSTTTESTNLVALYKALGGGWESTYPDEANLMAKE
jgi:NodT family efflux transporter outer membrane factor (OMF) lipoprotein